MVRDGVSDEDANVYAEGVRRGGTVVSVRTEERDASRIDRILQQHHGVEAQERGRRYRNEGWTRFDGNAPPYTRDQVERERAGQRALPLEPRSYAQDRGPAMNLNEGGMPSHRAPHDETSSPPT